MGTGRRKARMWLIWLFLVASLAGCASGGSSASSARSVAVAPMATAAPHGEFICADSRGSTQPYAYVGPGRQLYIVQGCASPVAVAAPAGRQLTPVSFSSSGTWLLAWNSSIDVQNSAAQDCLALIDLRSMALATTTSFCNPSGPNGPQWRSWYDIIDWVDDSSFYLSTTSTKDGSVTVSYVTIPALTPIPVTTLKWVANLAHRTSQVGDFGGFALHMGALYYGGYLSTSEGGAWLHRFSLTTQMDTRSVRLGVAGFGGCQAGLAPCAWTGPWDINADGSEVVYHSPGPTRSLSDTSVDANTPLYFAPTAGGQARRLFPDAPLGQGFNTPVLSSDGQYVAATFARRLMFERLGDGEVKIAPAGLAWQSWTPQPGVALVANDNLSGAPDHATHLELYNVETGAQTPLQPGTCDYVWG